MHTRLPAYLIVNADDFGYFPAVSRGILEAARSGPVRATGVLANSPQLEALAPELRACARLDVGVHLNLTHGPAQSERMRRALAHRDGRFPGRGEMTRALLGGGIGAADVRDEWAAQIERCRALGLAPRFLNSHEHLHMLPWLFRTAWALAREFEIPFVRFSAPELVGTASAGAWLRNALLAGLALGCGRAAARRSPRMLGASASGHLSADYLRRRLSKLRPGRVYELMCHPGHDEPGPGVAAHLRSYHDWEGELRLLLDPRTAALLETLGVQPIGYRDLRPASSIPELR